VNKFNGCISLSIKFLLLIISALFAILIAELGFRSIARIKNIDYRLYLQELKSSNRLPNELFIADDILHLKLRPNTQVIATTSDFSVIYRINSKGIRDKEYPYAKPKGKVRILAFGDSFTFGEGVEYGKRFTDIPESYNPDLEIINFGVPGWGIDQELIYLATEGLKYSPDYVVIFISQVVIERHSTDIIRSGSVVLSDIVSKPPTSNPSTLFLKRDDDVFNVNNSFILKNSHLISYLNYQITLMQLKRKFAQQDKKNWQDIVKNYKETKQALGHEHGNDHIAKRTKLIVKKFYEICNKSNINLIIVKIDTRGNLDYIANINENISYYDLTDGLRNERKSYSLSFKYDRHYNKKTHAYLGEKFLGILQDVVME